MYSDPVPIEYYVLQIFPDKKIQDIIADWRIEIEVIQKILIAHLKDLGFYAVNRMNADHVMGILLHHLRHSPELIQMIKKIEREEQMKRKQRHLDP